jgi:hypothetical protein
MTNSIGRHFVIIFVFAVTMIGEPALFAGNEVLGEIQFVGAGKIEKGSEAYGQCGDGKRRDSDLPGNDS